MYYRILLRSWSAAISSNNKDNKNPKDFGKLWMSLNLSCSIKEIKKVISSVNLIISNGKKDNKVKVRQFELKQTFPPYKYAILDLEGDPPKFFGIVVSNIVTQIFITDEKYFEEFYSVIWKVLNELIEFYLFTFSNTETRFFKRILPFRLKEAEDKAFLQILKIVNVQERDYEGLVPALYSLDQESYHDPLLRDSKKIELHFKKGDYYLILEHNKSCLLSTLQIVQKRYLKLHLI